MNIQQAKELLPIIQAFVEGKTIQYQHTYSSPLIVADNPNWIDVSPNGAIDFSDNPLNYRIKPEPKYRPFKNKEECWQEMLKHQPFGWIKSISNSEYLYSIVEIVDDCCIFVDGPKTSFYSLYKNSTFADGTPFGIKE